MKVFRIIAACMMALMVQAAMAFDFGWCTWYAQTEFDKVTPWPHCNWRGDAWQWYSNADAKGWETTPNLRDAYPGAIVVFGKKTAGSYGHVGIVRSVSSTGIVYQDMNGGSGPHPSGDPAKTNLFGIVDEKSRTYAQLTSAKFVGYVLPFLKGTKPAGLPVSQSSGDFNGDGRSDLAVIYKIATPGNPGSRMYVFYGTPSGLSNPQIKWEGADWLWESAMTFAGDFNGDGKSDLGVFYKVANPGQPGSRIWVFYGTSSGFEAPQIKWESPYWLWESAKPIAGDFNGDGKSDLAVFYKLGTAGNPGARVWMFYGTSTGFTYQSILWESPYWLWESAKPVAGDFNGDGKSDLAVFYKLGTPGNPGSRIWIFNGTSTGLSYPSIKWESPDWLWESAKPIAGDFDGDGRSDVAVFYKTGLPGNPSSRLWLFKGNTGGLSTPSIVWHDDGWLWESAKPVAGDFDDNGRTDLAVFYKIAAPGKPGSRIWRFNGGGTSFGLPAIVWESSYWTWESIK